MSIGTKAEPLFNYLSDGGRVVDRLSLSGGASIGAYVMHTSNDAILGAYSTAAEAREAIALANNARAMAQLCRDLAEGLPPSNVTLRSNLVQRAGAIIDRIAAATKGGA